MTTRERKFIKAAKKYWADFVKRRSYEGDWQGQFTTPEELQAAYLLIEAVEICNSYDTKKRL